MPPHSHSIHWGFGAGNTGEGWARVDGNSPGTQWPGTSSTGSGTDYMPPYYTVKAWRRIE